jgi:hypothetical protein
LQGTAPAVDVLAENLSAVGLLLLFDIV